MHDGHTAPGPARPAGAPRILVIRFSALGDVLLTFPAVAALRRRWPDAHIGFLTDIRFASLLDGLPAVDLTLPLDRLGLKRLSPAALAAAVPGLLLPLRPGRWDITIDLQGVGETALLAALTAAGVRVGRRGRRRAAWPYRPFVATPWPERYMAESHLDTLVRARVLPEAELDTWRSDAGRPFFTLTPAARAEWDRRREQVGLAAAGHVGLFVSAAKPEKRWPAERFALLAGALVRQLPEPDARVLVFAGPGDAERAGRVVAASPADVRARIIDGGTGSPGALAAAWANCRLVVSNDTGPMHLSVAVGTPTIGIFRRRMPHFIPPSPHRAIVAPDGGELDAIQVRQVSTAALATLRAQGIAGSSSS